MLRSLPTWNVLARSILIIHEYHTPSLLVDAGPISSHSRFDGWTFCYGHGKDNAQYNANNYYVHNYYNYTMVQQQRARIYLSFVFICACALSLWKHVCPP